ncbi:MAG: FMN-binding protein [Aerococcus sp.]|nr:FMN-binding protein [Aerococcus sp.]
MLKKRLLSSALLFTSFITLAACGNNDEAADNKAAEPATEETGSNAADAEALKDGEYKLETPMSDNGWRTEVVMTVTDGKVADINVESYDKDDNKKSEDEEYQKNMKAESGTSSNEAYEQLTKQFVETGDPDKVDVVSGATHTSESFKKQTKALLDAAKAGDTSVIKFEE